MLKNRIPPTSFPGSLILPPRARDPGNEVGIPQAWRIPQYRILRIKLRKYRKKNCPIPQYCKPQCPPPDGLSCQCILLFYGLRDLFAIRNLAGTFMGYFEMGYVDKTGFCLLSCASRPLPRSQTSLFFLGTRARALSSIEASEEEAVSPPCTDFTQPFFSPASRATD